MDVFVARQAIFDRKRNLYAYELLFRSGVEHNIFDGTDATSATTQVIANSLLSSIDNILCGKKAFINFDRDLLLGDLHSMLPPETLVVEILESVEAEPEIVSACHALIAEGYSIALDDFSGRPGVEPLTQFARFIKVDMRVTSRLDQKTLLRRYQPLGVTMLAEKVETQEEFEWAHSAGYDLFQGYFFARPAVLRGQQIASSKLTCLRLIAEMQRAEMDLDKVQKLISEDVSLSYKLLRYVNSAMFYRQVDVDSIARAIMIVGEIGLRGWVPVAALGSMSKDKPGELVTQSLVRASFCERISRLAAFPRPNLAFLMGLFSYLDALIDIPLEQALHQVSVAPEIRDALLETSSSPNPLRDVFQLACHYDAGDWDATSALASSLRIKAPDVAGAYAEATLWAHQTLEEAHGRKNSRRSPRFVMTGTVSLVWKDMEKRQRTGVGRIRNVSAHGLQLWLEERIPEGTSIACGDPKLGISGTGVVRYCSPSKGKFLIGVEFSNGTGWREPIVRDTMAARAGPDRSS
ncbi:MAG: EAL domain-containing protein [Bryobacteraceae bacterium]